VLVVNDINQTFLKQQERRIKKALKKACAKAIGENPKITAQKRDKNVEWLKVAYWHFSFVDN
jgi:hypothetical protein